MGGCLSYSYFGTKDDKQKKFPVACVVSELNQSAIENLKPMYAIKENSSENYIWLHTDLNDALDYVEKQIT